MFKSWSAFPTLSFLTHINPVPLKSVRSSSCSHSSSAASTTGRNAHQHLFHGNLPPSFCRSFPSRSRASLYMIPVSGFLPPPSNVMTLSTLPIAPMTKWRPPCCLEGELAEIEYRITSGHVWSLELFMPYQNFNTVRVGGTSFTTFHLTLIEDIHARFFPFSTMRSSVDVLSFYVKLCNNLCQWAYTAERSWNLFVRWTS